MKNFKFVTYFLCILIFSIIVVPISYATSTFCYQLQGLQLYSQEAKPVFLGSFTSKYDSDSIANKYGSYGGKYSSDSIFNRFGRYGSKYDTYSPWNAYTSDAPYIVDNSFNILGVLTLNKYKSGAIDPFAALSCLIPLDDERFEPFLDLMDSSVKQPLPSTISTPTLPSNALINLSYQEYPSAINLSFDNGSKITFNWSIPKASTYSIFVFQKTDTGYKKVLGGFETNNTFYVLDKGLLVMGVESKLEVDAYDQNSRYLGYSNYFFTPITATNLGPINSVQNNAIQDFTDIDYNSFRDAIRYVKSKGIVDGYTDNTYRPGGLINRAELTKIVVNALGYTPTGNNCFKDVKNEWFAPYVCTAKEKKILDGYKDGTFKPAANINQAEAVKILVQAFSVPKSGSTGPQWYDVFMNSARNEGVFVQFVEKASDPLLRGEMAQLIYNILYQR